MRIGDDGDRKKIKKTIIYNCFVKGVQHSSEDAYVVINLLDSSGNNLLVTKCA